MTDRHIAVPDKDETLRTRMRNKLIANGYIEGFNGRLRVEYHTQHIFPSLVDSQKRIELWRQDYNQARPHGSLGWLMPAAYRKKNIKAAQSITYFGIDNRL